MGGGDGSASYGDAAATISTGAGFSAPDPATGQEGGAGWMINNGAAQMNAALTSAYNTSQSALNQYYGQALASGQPWANDGLQAYQTYINQFNPADAQQNLNNFLGSAGVTSIFGNVSNPNGTAGSSGTALGNFNQSSDYQFVYNNAMQAAQQAASAGGYLNTPQMALAMQSQGAGLASQQYNNYASLMQSAYSQYMGGMQSASNIGLSAMQGNQTVQTGLGSALANVATNYGSDVANTDMWQATNDADARLTQAQAFANQDLLEEAGSDPAIASIVPSVIGADSNVKV